MKIEKINEGKGITLIALVITIIVLLILAGVALSLVVGEDGITNYADNSATCTINDDGQVVWEGAVPVGNVWTQNKTKVSNGTIELDVGTKVTGYSVEGHTDLEWYVLGAKSGKLLITTNTCPEEVELEGMENAISTLNSKAEKYTNSEYAEGRARTIDVDDINRVTGYDPKTATCDDSGELYELRNEVTYSWDGTDYPAYSASNGLTGNLEGKHNSGFSYYDIDTNDWVTVQKASSGEITTLTSTPYWYYPKTLTTNNSDPQNGIPTDGAAYTLLFSNTGYYPDDTGSYWLGSPYVYCGTFYTSFGLRRVYDGGVGYGSYLADSYGYEGSNAMGVRPVVSLQSDIQIDTDGKITK